MGSRPDYNVGAMDKRTGERNNRVGVAWRNPDGTVAISLDPFVRLEGGGDVTLRLFPIEGGPEKVPKEPGKPGGGAPEIPF